jgi:hypothetical protein
VKAINGVLAWMVGFKLVWAGHRVLIAFASIQATTDPYTVFAPMQATADPYTVGDAHSSVSMDPYVETALLLGCALTFFLQFRHDLFFACVWVLF